MAAGFAALAAASASPSPSPPPALLTGERLVVFLFAARVALAAPAGLAAPLAILAAAALAVELAVDGSASPLRRFRTRCADTLLPPHPRPSRSVLPPPPPRSIGLKKVSAIRVVFRGVKNWGHASVPPRPGSELGA
jgi:hypothetical protein